MPKYGYMISKAVELVARKLAEYDPETISRLSNALSEEAQAISDEMNNEGESIDADILAARLEGVVTRMKYEARNQGPDPSPHEFPIFNVSHNPSAPYPNPINHLYDKRYKEAYSTFIKQNPQPAVEPAKPSVTPTPSAPTPSVPRPTATPTPRPPAPSAPSVTPRPQQNPAYGQVQYQQAPPGWPYTNPYATMPRSQAAYYQQQSQQQQRAQMNMPSIPEQSMNGNTNSGLPRSSLSDDYSYSTDSNGEKIRVRVIDDNAINSMNPNSNLNNPSRQRSQRSILKSNSESDDNLSSVTPNRMIYSASGEPVGQETMREIFQVVDQQSSDAPGSSATERIIIIDRRGSSTPDDNLNLSGKDRLRTFEIRAVPTPTVATTPTSPTTPSTPITPAPTVPTTPMAAPSPAPIANSSVPSAYAVRPNVYYPAGQQLQYQQPRIYGSMPANLYGSQSQFPMGARSFYPMMYYRY